MMNFVSKKMAGIKSGRGQWDKASIEGCFEEFDDGDGELEVPAHAPLPLLLLSCSCSGSGSGSCSDSCSCSCSPAPAPALAPALAPAPAPVIVSEFLGCVFPQVSELHGAFELLNMKPSSEEIESLLMTYDADGSGSLDKEEFVRMMYEFIQNQDPPTSGESFADLSIAGMF